VKLVEKYRIVPWVFGVMIIIVLLARTIQAYNYAGYGIVQMGLMSDRICSRGSYEMMVCLPDSIPPYETIMVVLIVLLLFSVLRMKGK